MRSKLFGLVFVVLVVCFVGNTMGATVVWNHLGADNLWTTGLNWSTGAKPGLGDYATIHGGAGISPYTPEFKAGMTESIDTLRVGCGYMTAGQDILDISGGYLTVAEVATPVTGNEGNVLIYAKNNGGTIAMSNGTLEFEDTMTIGVDGNPGTGYLNMTGGLVKGDAVDATHIWVTGNGHINLHGGDIVVSYLGLQGGSMDITTGMLTMNGSSALFWMDWSVANGTITAYNGNGTIMRSYEGGVAKMWAVPEPATMILLGIGGLLSLRRKR